MPFFVREDEIVISGLWNLVYCWKGLKVSTILFVFTVDMMWVFGMKCSQQETRCESKWINESSMPNQFYSVANPTLNCFYKLIKC